jgi:hypothetical protein
MKGASSTSNGWECAVPPPQRGRGLPAGAGFREGGRPGGVEKAPLPSIPSTPEAHLRPQGEGRFTLSPPSSEGEG